MKDRNYWLERGKGKPQFDGFVCLGIGDKDKTLKDWLGLKDNRIWILSEEYDKMPENGYIGNDPDCYYYLTNRDFDELFPVEKETLLAKEAKQILNNLEKYIRTLDYKWASEVSEKTLILDVIYGLGIFMDSKFEFADGFKEFKKKVVDSFN